MKILAKRDNTIFVVAPIMLIVSFICLFALIDMKIDIKIDIDVADIGFGLLYSVTFIRFFLRLSVPPVILEYDDNFLYVNRRFKESIAISYKNFIDVSDVKEKVDFKEMRYLKRKIIWLREDYEKYYQYLIALATTGVLNLNYEGGYIRLHGIKNVETVETELEKIIREKKRENTEKIEGKLAEMQRQRELEELAKHDINT